MAGGRGQLWRGLCGRDLWRRATPSVTHIGGGWGRPFHSHCTASPPSVAGPGRPGPVRPVPTPRPPRHAAPRGAQRHQAAPGAAKRRHAQPRALHFRSAALAGAHWHGVARPARRSATHPLSLTTSPSPPILSYPVLSAVPRPLYLPVLCCRISALYPRFIVLLFRSNNLKPTPRTQAAPPLLPSGPGGRQARQAPGWRAALRSAHAPDNGFWFPFASLSRPSPPRPASRRSPRSPAGEPRVSHCVPLRETRAQPCAAHRQASRVFISPDQKISAILPSQEDIKKGHRGHARQELRPCAQDAKRESWIFGALRSRLRLLGPAIRMPGGASAVGNWRPRARG